MNLSLHELSTGIFAAVEAKDVEAMMRYFAEDATLIDPHFPLVRMQGKAAIADGMRSAIAQMQSFGYTTINYFESADGQHAAVETATHHVSKQGKCLNFPQVFVFDAQDGHITRMQAYEPYGPSGMMGVFLFLARLGDRFATLWKRRDAT